MIRAKIKRIIRGIYAFRCGYCGVTEAQAGSELTFDHFRPQSQAGTDETANLVYACHACNEFKGEYWSQDSETRLLHPLTDNFALHIAEEADGRLHSLTVLGEVYISRLQLNRSALVGNRLERQMRSRLDIHLVEITDTLHAILSEVKKRQT